MRFGPREAVFVFLLIAVIVATYFFVFMPGDKEITEAREEIASKQMKLKELEAATKSINDLGSEIDRLREAITLVEQKLPAQRDVEIVLRDVWRLAAENKLTPKSVRTDKIVENANYAELPIKMTIVGDFAGFYTFLQEVEKLPRITRIPTMTLKKMNKEDGIMQADMVLSIFFEGQKRQANAD